MTANQKKPRVNSIRYWYLLKRELNKPHDGLWWTIKAIDAIGLLGWGILAIVVGRFVYVLLNR